MTIRFSVCVLLFAICTPCAVRGQAAATREQPAIQPVEYYRDVRGAIVYRTYCVLCHGAKADGKGRAARHYSPPPADLTTSQTSDAYKELIVRKGGAAVGRSQFMPPWEQELTTEQIEDVIHYLRVINVESRRAR
jgi:mono/diheme cytochrome c family protein